MAREHYRTAAAADKTSMRARIGRFFRRIGQACHKSHACSVEQEPLPTTRRGVRCSDKAFLHARIPPVSHQKLSQQTQVASSNAAMPPISVSATDRSPADCPDDPSTDPKSCSLDKDIRTSSDVAYFAPTSFRARANALGHPFAGDTAVKGGQQVIRGRLPPLPSKSPARSPFSSISGANRMFTFNPQEDMLGDPLAEGQTACVSSLTERSLSPTAVVTPIERLLSKYLVKPTTCDMPGPASSCMKPVREMTAYRENANAPPKVELYDREYPPTSNDLSYKKRPVKHLLLDQAGQHTMPSMSLPTPQLSWTGIPIIIGRIPGTSKQSPDPRAYIRLMVDTGAEKSIIKKSSCPWNTKFFPVPCSQIGGLGGEIVVTEVAYFKLIFTAKDVKTSRNVDIAIIVCADVFDDRQKPAPAMHNFDAIFGYPAVLAHRADIIAGDHTSGSSKILLKLSPSRIHDPAVFGNSIFNERQARNAFEIAPIDVGLVLPRMERNGWQPRGVRYASHTETKCVVEIPVATCTGYGAECHAPIAVEQWYEGGGNVKVRTRLARENGAGCYDLV